MMKNYDMPPQEGDKSYDDCDAYIKTPGCFY